MVKDIRFLHEELRYETLNNFLDTNFVILGCGALGANLTLSLVRKGFRRFVLCDDSRIEEHNISTQPWLEADFGSSKANILMNLCANINLEGFYTPNRKRIVKYSQIETIFETVLGPGELDIAVDTFDNSQSRTVVYDLGLHNPGLDVLHAGMSAWDTSEITWNESYVVPKDVYLADPCNYPLSRDLVEMTVTLASKAILHYLLDGVKINYFLNMNGAIPSIKGDVIEIVDGYPD